MTKSLWTIFFIDVDSSPGWLPAPLNGIHRRNTTIFCRILAMPIQPILLCSSCLFYRCWFSRRNKDRTIPKGPMQGGLPPPIQTESSAPQIPARWAQDQSQCVQHDPQAQRLDRKMMMTWYIPFLFLKNFFTLSLYFKLKWLFCTYTPTFVFEKDAASWPESIAF